MKTAGRTIPPLGVIDRYVLREFIRYYLLSLGGFVGFVLLFDAFEKLDTFIDYDATILDILRYYWNVLPYRALVVAPVAPLLATFLCLGYRRPGSPSTGCWFPSTWPDWSSPG